MKGKIALFTAESAGVGAGLQELIERYGDRIELVVLSNVYAGGGLMTPVNEIRDAVRSGRRRFFMFLQMDWVEYFGLLTMDRVFRAVTRRPRVRSTVRELCRRKGIEHVTVGNVNDPKFVADLARRDIDLIVSFQCDQIFHEDLIAAARTGVLNVHPTYLPNGRGRWPVISASVFDDVVSGATVHEIVDRGIDTGPILAQQRIALPPEKTILYHEHICYSTGAALLARVLDDYDSYHARGVPQGEGSYHGYPTWDEMRAALKRGVRMASRGDLIELTYESAEECRRRWVPELDATPPRTVGVSLEPEHV